jgi:hypothetical protein
MMAPSGMVPHLIVADDVYRLSRWMDLVIVDWKGLPTKDRLRAFEGAIQETATPDRKVTVVVRLRPGLGVPASELRDEITRVMRDSQNVTAGWCVILEGDGFFAATHRSLTATMHLLSGSKVKLKVFKTPSEAATWVVQLSPDHSAGDVAMAIEHGV